MTTVRQATSVDLGLARPAAGPKGTQPAAGRPGVQPAVEPPDVQSAAGTPQAGGAQVTTRQARRLEQKRLLREELAAVAVLALLLVVTLVLLGLQWLSTGSPSAAPTVLFPHGGFT